MKKIISLTTLLVLSLNIYSPSANQTLKEGTKQAFITNKPIPKKETVEKHIGW